MQNGGRLIVMYNNGIKLTAWPVAKFPRYARLQLIPDVTSEGSVS